MSRGEIKFNKCWAEKWYRFLDELRKHGNASQAARAAEVIRRDMFAIKDLGPERLREWVEALEESTDSLVLEANRRGRDGVVEDVYYNGEVVGQKIRYSDTLLMFLIKGQRPQYATERREISGPDGGEIPVPPISLTGLDDHELKMLLDMARKLRSTEFREA